MIVDIIFRSDLVGSSLLRASEYFDRKGLACYVLTLHNQNSYGKLSILLLFILSRDTPSEVNFVLLYFDIRHKCYFIMFNL